MSKLIGYFARYFHNLGLNVTCIGNYRNEFNLIDNNLLKAPNHSWRCYFNRRQSKEELEKYDWERSTGLGIVLGYDNVFAIDVDGCVEPAFLHLILDVLDLPRHYDWVTRSGSFSGFHIIFRCMDKPTPDPNDYYTLEGIDNFGFLEVNAHYPKSPNSETFDEAAIKNIFTSYFTDKYSPQLLFKKLEFRWYGHLVLPPSLHKSGKKYEFVNATPESYPSIVEFGRLKYIYNVLCSNSADWSGMDRDRYQAKRDDEQIRIHHAITPCFLFIDCETNGLPIDNTQPPSRSTNWPPMVQIAWSITDKNFNQIKRQNYIVNSQGSQTIDNGSKIHGITTDIIELIGCDIRDVLKLFLRDVLSVRYLISHNFHFDSSVILSEMHRYGLNTEIFNQKSSFCTMEASKVHCELKTPRGLKLPSLTELYYKLFNNHINTEHNACYDLTVLEMCFAKLVNEKIISIPSLSIDIG